MTVHYPAKIDFFGILYHQTDDCREYQTVELFGILYRQTDDGRVYQQVNIWGILRQLINDGALSLDFSFLRYPTIKHMMVECTKS